MNKIYIFVGVLGVFVALLLVITSDTESEPMANIKREIKQSNIDIFEDTLLEITKKEIKEIENEKNTNEHNYSVGTHNGVF